MGKSQKIAAMLMSVSIKLWTQQIVPARYKFPVPPQKMELLVKKFSCQTLEAFITSKRMLFGKGPFKNFDVLSGKPLKD